ncbi:mRNA-decapping enzyme 1B isoform X1 [Manis pentadactyla]|uniref:mRNA-decapping enzyme 1B isoform X1 n=1 Tax=Manis pentadactyla TaxID=143292 RepID=UPI00255C96AB|nr:mRNA-decapping enzyme 1B isoform X1 [Manis pentadactyla]KAI5126030.1 Mrna-Decapping Enzyme 1B [Manis pentadactyla]
MASVAAGGLVGQGRDISLAALQRHDPYINRIVDVASQVALYTFGHRANEWEKTDVEGTLFVYTRSASPQHGFTIMNRLSMENRTEPITKDLDFQLQDPFLLYRNARFSIHGIWFYDKEECQRIAELMKNLIHYEQLRAHQGAGPGISPVIVNSGDSREVDILRMLTKAKDEYTKCKACSEPKQIASSSAIYDNPNLIKPIPVKPGGSQQQCLPRPSQALDPEPHHLSLMALFGKEHRATCQEAMGPPQALHQQQEEKLPLRQGVARSLSYEEPRRQSSPTERQLCPAIQKLMVGSADLRPLSELPESRPCNSGRHSAGEVSAGPGQPAPPHNTSRTQNLLAKLQSTPGTANKYNLSSAAAACSPAPNLGPAAPGEGVAQAQLVRFNSSLPPQSLGCQAHGKEQPTLPRQTFPLWGNQTSSSGVISPQELLKKLQLVEQEQQPPASNRPALAAKFPMRTQSSRTGNHLESWIDKTSSTEKHSPLLRICPEQVISPQHIPAPMAPALLMTPMVFTQPTCAPPKEKGSGLLPLESREPAAACTGLLPLQKPEPAVIANSPLSKPQLQEALLYLLQNDDNFLNIIYEAYLFSMTQAAMKKTV